MGTPYSSSGEATVLIDCVDQLKHVAAGHVTTNRGHHRLGHLPQFGWFCCCAAGTRCRQIHRVRDLVPPMTTTRRSP